MKLSEFIRHAQLQLENNGDFEITRGISGASGQYRPMLVTVELCKGARIKKRIVTDDEEITTKRRQTLYQLNITEDVGKD